MLKVGITGLDKLTRTLEEARRALESLDGEVAKVQFDCNDVLSIQKAISRMEKAVDERLKGYRSNPIVAKLGEASKEQFRNRLLAIASSTRNSSAQLTSLKSGSEDENMGSPIELKRRQRFEFMNKLYEATDGDDRKLVSAEDVAGQLEFEENDARLAIQYLDGEGLLKIESLDWYLRITHLGVVEVESALQNPEKPTVHFPPVQNIIHIGTMTNSVIQQGSANSPQAVTLGDPNLQTVKEFLDAVRSQVSNLPLTAEEKQEAISDIATAAAQIDSPKPKRDILRSSLGALITILKGVSTSVVSREISAHLPAIETFIRSLS
jgi:hypothetical protein